MTRPDNQLHEKYPDSSHARMLMFELPNGTCTMFNYQYLISTSCSAGGDILELDFTTHSVKLTGVRLSLLYHKLAEHLPRIVKCRQERFNTLLTEQPIIHAIGIEKKQSIKATN
ncbi:hypothetical protein CAP35_04715 [Chitinophagaceae bacterium IBVUCB1]|nr:hypothetical protein CAP35_04715 [Chitinophagaceae bacterium IBVUCB1]